MHTLVAIIGRPNVGKSTLFNRLVASRQAIVANQEGTTRDRHYGVADWNGKAFTVIDTGGFIQKEEEVLNRHIKEHIQVAMEEADVILFVVDVIAGLTAGDEELTELVRKCGKPCLVVANKSDNTEKALLSSGFYILGLGNVYPISANNGSGTGELLDDLVSLSKKEEAEEQNNLPKVAILGKTNVGKSSLLNILLAKERSIVSSEMHTTRDSIHSYYQFSGKELILIDTAGIRKKNKLLEEVDFYASVRSIRAIQSADVCFIVLDATQPVTKQDVHILQLALFYKKGLVVLINKWDLITDPVEKKEARSYFEKKLHFISYAPRLFTSNFQKKNIYQAIEKALMVYEETKKRISTKLLNDTLLPILKLHAPVYRGKRVKIKYITQLPTAYPAFGFFTNVPDFISNNYKSFLGKKVREFFSFTGVPISIKFCS